MGNINKNGLVLWEGPRKVAIITGITDKSANGKTGDMLQIWILAKGEKPSEAIKSGLDSLVCGNCPLRPANNGGCYVNVGQAPNAVWRCFQRGGYAHWDGRPFGGKVRVGAYGDLAFIPMAHLSRIMAACVKGWTSYTHQWRARPDLAKYAMASVHSPAEVAECKGLGFRPFLTSDHKVPGVTLCPSERGMSCATCGGCNGAPAGNKRAGFYIPAHGTHKAKLQTL